MTTVLPALCPSLFSQLQPLSCPESVPHKHPPTHGILALGLDRQQLKQAFAVPLGKRAFFLLGLPSLKDVSWGPGLQNFSVA